jgi:ABC-type phosphate transport system substrate-binding protein
MRKLALLYLLSVLAAFGDAHPSAAHAPRTVSVIAHRALALGSVSRDELRPIFQTRKTTWPDGSNVRPFNLPPSSSARQVFDEVVLSLPPGLMPRFWIDRRVRGDAGPPTTVPNEQLMLQVVKSLRGAVGYVEAPISDPGVKVIARISAGQVVRP